MTYVSYALSQNKNNNNALLTSFLLFFCFCLCWWENSWMQIQKSVSEHTHLTTPCSSQWWIQTPLIAHCVHKLKRWKLHKGKFWKHIFKYISTDQQRKEEKTVSKAWYVLKMKSKILPANYYHYYYYIFNFFSVSKTFLFSDSIYIFISF